MPLIERILNPLTLLLLIALVVGLPFTAMAKTGEYYLHIERKTVSITGKPLVRITINGGIPGPTLRFKEGDEAVIHVTNHLEEDSSVHWHGLLLPGDMDGVPGMNGFPGIKPGETFTYRFPIRQAGTYWYHAHSLGQEQEGHYGSIVITPLADDKIAAKRDYVVLLSDFTPENPEEVLGNIKMDSGYYNFYKRTIGDFFSDLHSKGVEATIQDRKEWGQMRMTPTDLSDVSGYTFLTNGKTPEQNWTGIFKPGDKVRLRFINASAMTFYDLRIPGLKMTVVEADGQQVEPVAVDELRFGIAETYDVIVQPMDDRAYTIVAESIDRTGFALSTLAPRQGMRGEVPQHRPRALLTMHDMHMPSMMEIMPDMDMSSPSAMESGWAKAGTPVGHKQLSYEDLRYRGTQEKNAAPDREITVRLGGNMERFIWTINGKKFEHSSPIQLRYGERVRITYVNETMMAHPMHLHGMFVQLDNGQPADKLPNKHTVIVPPGQSYSVFLTADEPGQWAFHCHLLYHMLGGMMTEVVVAEFAPQDMPKDIPTTAAHDGGNHHAH